MQAIGRRSHRTPDGAPVHYERHRPERTTLSHLVQQHAASSRAGAQRQRCFKASDSTLLVHSLPLAR